MVRFKIPITIERMDPRAEEWVDHVPIIYANVNKAMKDNEYLDGGAQQSRRTLAFKMRHFPKAEDIATRTQLYRIKYNGQFYNIVDYDDYMERHHTITLVGVSENG